MTQRALIPAPEAFTCVARGFDQLAALIATTLGPTQGVILSQRSHGQPEVLTHAGTIAQRVIQLPIRGEDAGAMILRNLVFGQHERYGDGAATAAVLARAIVGAAQRRIAGGNDPMLMRRGIERAVPVATSAIRAQATPAHGQEVLMRLATGVTGDAELGRVLGEMFDLLGADAALQIDEYAAPHLEREYLDGGRWRGRPAARALMPEGQASVVYSNPLLFVADQKIDAIEQVWPALEYVASLPDHPPLLLLARELGGEALTMLTLNYARGLINIGAVVITGGTPHASDDLADIALLSGAEVMADLRGRPLGKIVPGFFGRVRRAVVTQEAVTLISGAGEQATIRTRVNELRGYANQLKRNDPAWKQIRERIARLSGGVGILKIGAHTERERDAKKALAEKAVQVLESALHEGVVPGGGAAYLAAIPAVRTLQQQEPHADIAQGIALVAEALSAPFAQIVANHGSIHPPLALAAVAERGAGYGFDCIGGSYADMRARGVLDSARIVAGALEAAASAAALVLTTDIVVLTSPGRRETSSRP